MRMDLVLSVSFPGSLPAFFLYFTNLSFLFYLNVVLNDL